MFTVQRCCPAFREDHAILVQNLLITDTVAVLLGHFPMKTCPHGQLSHPQYKLISTPDLFVPLPGALEAAFVSTRKLSYCSMRARLDRAPVTMAPDSAPQSRDHTITRSHSIKAKLKTLIDCFEVSSAACPPRTSDCF